MEAFIKHAILSLYSIQNSFIYLAAMFYIGAYPLFGSVLWISTAIVYWIRRERGPIIESKLSHYPKVSVVISAFNEEKLLRQHIDSLCALDYPDYEIIIINDGSKDKTAQIIEEYEKKGLVRFIDKKNNEGKAMAINDAMMCCNGEILFVMDADAIAQPDILRQLVPHFTKPRVAAVAGNPRVLNTINFLTRMQLIEYSSIISMIRRSQRIWGRIMAFSGVVFAVRKSALFDVGGFSPSAATEDIDLTWKLQKKFYDVLYESKAVAWVNVPKTYPGFFRQRLRWARGLMHVLHRNYDIIFHWKYRRMWPVFIENALSTLWAICFVAMACLWIISSLLRFPLLGASVIPHVWGTILATLTLILCAVGLTLDRKYDPQLPEYYPYAVYYPIYYWILLAIIAVWALPALFKKPKTASTWISER